MAKAKKYNLTLECNGKKKRVSGDSLLSCLGKLKEETYYKTLCYLTIYKGDKEARKMFTPVRFKVIMSGMEINRVILAKNLSILLGE